MKSPMCQVVHFSAIDDYVYTGLLFLATPQSKKTIIHIHGMCGNMLSFSSLLQLADEYTNNGYNLLTFNLKAHDCIAEGNWGDSDSSNDYFFYVGGSLEPFERCIVDIESAIKYCNEFSDEIILQGHSMGCERIITYQLETKKYYNTILISPCDARQLQEDYIYPLSLEDQILSLEKYDDMTILPPEYFGINNQKGENYTIPITKKALLSILTGYALKVFSQKEDMPFFLPISCLCIIGENDPLQTYNPQKAFAILNKKFNHFKGHSMSGDHEIKPMQCEMSKIVTKWLKSF